jgi:transcriptional regulator with XRE-family HTH domain
MDKVKVGNFIYSLRKEKHISQGQLGILLGVTNKAVSKWENGNNQPEVAMLYKLSEVLGVSVDELAKGERAAPKSESSLRQENAALTKRVAQAERDEATSERKFFFVDLYLYTVVSLFFLFLYLSMYSFINFGGGFWPNLLFGLACYWIVPTLLFVGIVTGAKFLERVIKTTSPVLSIVLLTFFPLSIAFFIAAGVVLSIPLMVKAKKICFNPAYHSFEKDKPIVYKYLISLLAIFIVAALTLLFFGLYRGTDPLFTLVYVPLLFLFLAGDTIVFGVFASKRGIF